jgi:hypothetical protein
VKLHRLHGELRVAKTAGMTSCIHTAASEHHNHERQTAYLYQIATASSLPCALLNRIILATSVGKKLSSNRDRAHMEMMRRQKRRKIAPSHGEDEGESANRRSSSTSKRNLCQSGRRSHSRNLLLTAATTGPRGSPIRELDAEPITVPQQHLTTTKQEKRERQSKGVQIPSKEDGRERRGTAEECRDTT